MTRIGKRKNSEFGLSGTVVSNVKPKFYETRVFKVRLNFAKPKPRQLKPCLNHGLQTSLDSASVGLEDEFMWDGEKDEFFSRDHCHIADFTQQLRDHEDISDPLIGSNTSIWHNPSCTIRLIFPTRKIRTSGRLTRKQGPVLHHLKKKLLGTWSLRFGTRATAPPTRYTQRNWSWPKLNF